MGTLAATAETATREELDGIPISPPQILDFQPTLNEPDYCDVSAVLDADDPGTAELRVYAKKRRS